MRVKTLEGEKTHAGGRLRAVLPALLAGTIAAACGTNGDDGPGDPSGTGGGAGAAGFTPAPGCSTSPDCDACTGCYAFCVCSTGLSDQCGPSCGEGASGGGPAAGGSGPGSGGSGAGNTGGTGAGAGGTGAGGTGGGVPPGEDCSSYPFSLDVLLSERVGFGRNAGGSGYKSRMVSSTSELREALESSESLWIVFGVGDVNEALFEVSATGQIVRSNKIIDGRGRNIHISGNLQLDSNVVLADVRLSNDRTAQCTQEGDVITVDGSGVRDVWLHHVELFHGGDGLFDVRRGATDITLSWSHFHTHKKGMLLANKGDDADGMQLTFHHNFFDRLSLRGPQLRYGRVHYFNNYQFEWYEYGAASLLDAQLLSERNVYQARPGTFCAGTCPDPNPCGDNDFEVSKLAVVNDWGGDCCGNIRSVEDLALEGALIAENNPGSVFDASGEYPYVAEPATQELAARIAAEAGPRVDYCR